MPINISPARDVAREFVAFTMRGTAVIQAYSWASDGIGGGTALYTASGTVACTVSPDVRRYERGAEGVHAEMLQAAPKWLVTMPHGGTVTTNDRIISGGVTYEVNEVNTGQSDQVYTLAKCTVLS